MGQGIQHVHIDPFAIVESRELSGLIHLCGQFSVDCKRIVCRVLLLGHSWRYALVTNHDIRPFSSDRNSDRKGEQGQLSRGSKSKFMTECGSMSSQVLSTSAKVAAILQLCLVFSVILWVMVGPFMGSYFTTKSSQLLYKAVIGAPAPEGNIKEARASELFAALPEKQRERIALGYQQVQQQTEKTFLGKSADAIRTLFLGLPSFTQAWLFFSFVISLMLLLRIEGAATAAWVLPLVALAYGYDNRFNGVSSGTAPDAVFFPSEQYLESTYLSEPLQGSFAEQNAQLTDAWRRFLIAEWLHETPNSDVTAFADQVERGEHAFHLARIEKRLEASDSMLNNSSFTKKPIPLLVVYVLANLGFAIVVNRRR